MAPRDYYLMNKMVVGSTLFYRRTLRNIISLKNILKPIDEFSKKKSFLIPHHSYLELITACNCIHTDKIKTEYGYKQIYVSNYPVNVFDIKIYTNKKNFIYRINNYNLVTRITES